MTPRPMIYTWTGEAMVPAYPRIADGLYTVGERYKLEIIEERTRKTHAHYFACLHDIWMNLPEDLAEEFPTEDHLRKKALIRVGYADEQSFVCSSHAEAVRFMAFLKPIDSFAVITVSRNVVKRWTAQSQSVKAMGKKTFQDSKQKVLDYCSGLIGVTTETIAKNAGMAA